MHLYLGHSNPGQAFGAASALAVLLVWVYYSGIILLLGAEFTQTLTEARGRHIEPSKGAIKVTEYKMEGTADRTDPDAGDRDEHDRSVTVHLPGRDLHLLHRVVTIPKDVGDRDERL